MGDPFRRANLLYRLPHSFSLRKKEGQISGFDPLQLPVPGGKLWMGTEETLLVYRNIIFELVVSLQP